MWDVRFLKIPMPFSALSGKKKSWEKSVPKNPHAEKEENLYGKSKNVRIPMPGRSWGIAHSSNNHVFSLENSHGESHVFQIPMFFLLKAVMGNRTFSQ